MGNGKVPLPINRFFLGWTIILYGVSALLYPYLPDRVPAHWNVTGEVDRYAGKLFHVLFFPSLILGLYLLMGLAPVIEPKKGSYEKFRNTFEFFRALITIFFSFLYLITTLYALGTKLSVGKMILFAMGLLWLFLGNSMGKIRHNFTFGIKTPWTLANEEVWNKTHRASGPLWVGMGIVWMSSTLLPERGGFILAMSTLVGIVIFGFGYSYFLFGRIKKNGRP